MPPTEDNRGSSARWTAIAGIITAVLGVVSSPAWGPPLCSAVGVCKSTDSPPSVAATTSSGAAPTTPGGKKQSAEPMPVTSVSRTRPGCEESDARVVWKTVQADLSCESSGTKVAKTVGWDDAYMKSYGELRMSVRGQQFPGTYTVSFTIGGLSAPQTDSNRGGCGGLAVHTSATGQTYDYFNVCGDGWIEAFRVVNASGVDNKTAQIAAAPSYTVVVTVTTTNVEITVSNGNGGSKTLSWPAVGRTTAYVSLMTTWRDIGATASFSDFSYSAA